MAGKGGKGLLAAKTTAAKTAEKDKGKKAPVSRSSRAGLQVTRGVPSSLRTLLFARLLRRATGDRARPDLNCRVSARGCRSHVYSTCCYGARVHLCVSPGSCEV